MKIQSTASSSVHRAPRLAAEAPTVKGRPVQDVDLTIALVERNAGLSSKKMFVHEFSPHAGRTC